jgi:hypothetical protein
LKFLLLICLFSSMVVNAASIDSRYISDSFDTLFSAKDTDDLSEGTTNKYYADSLARAAISDNSDGITYTSATGVISCDVASGSIAGCLSSTDWNTFNGKQDALGFTAVPDTRTVNGHALSSNVTVTASDVSAVPDATFTAKGDMVLGTGAGTYSVLSAGANDYVLTADSSTGTGLKWAAIPATVSGHKENKTLVAGDISNGYVDLSVECKTDTVHVGLEGLGYAIEGVDYTVSVESSVTRITFAGDFIAGGTALVVDDVLYFKCLE